MQSVIYGGDVCGISLQFRRKRHVLDINSFLALICVVSDISLSGEHHTNHWYDHTVVECKLNFLT